MQSLDNTTATDPLAGLSPADIQQLKASGQYDDYVAHQNQVAKGNAWTNNLTAQNAFVPQTADEWWAAHGNPDAPRYANVNGTTVDSFTQAYNPNGPGSSPALTALYNQLTNNGAGTPPAGSGTVGPVGDAAPFTPTTSNTLQPTNNTPTPSSPGGQTLPAVGALQGFTNGNPTAGPSTPRSSTNSASTAPTLTPLTPDNALTNSIISPASNVNRFDVANQQLKDTIANTLEPQFNADARTIAANSFGAGRGVSGMNRTAEGNLALQHSRDINQLTSNFLNPALTGTIQDSLNNANFAAGQQQFEAGQQGQAFGQNYALQQLADSEDQQQFSQALQKLLAGSQGDPAQIQLLLAELFGGQSAQSSNAAGTLAKSAVG